MSEHKWDNCIVIASVEGHPYAERCRDRGLADEVAKTQAERSGSEVAIYQLVGVWKPKALPVEFVAAEREREREPVEEEELPRRGAPRPGAVPAT